MRDAVEQTQRNATTQSFAGVAHGLRGFRIARHGTCQHGGRVVGDQQGVGNLFLGYQGDRAGDLVNGLWAARAGDDDAVHPDRILFFGFRGRRFLRLGVGLGLVGLGRVAHSSRLRLLGIQVGADGSRQQQDAEFGRYMLHGVFSGCVCGWGRA